MQTAVYNQTVYTTRADMNKNVIAAMFERFQDALQIYHDKGPAWSLRDILIFFQRNERLGAAISSQQIWYQPFLNFYCLKQKIETKIILTVS